MQAARLTTLTLVVAASASTAAGCKAFQGRAVVVEYCGQLEDSTHVHLIQDVHQDVLRTDPERNYADLYLSLIRDDFPISESGVGHVAGRFNENPRLTFGALEGRAGDDDTRIWIIDVDKQRIIASLDRKTNTVTGYNETPPLWATRDGGNLIRTSK